MKPLSTCTTIFLLASLAATACSFYPYQEEFRFCFYKPGGFDYHTYHGFEYDANAHAPTEPYLDSDTIPNVLDWMKYCKNRVSEQAIEEAIYDLPQLYYNVHASNAMEKYLSVQHDTIAINYINFAKRCEAHNTYISDPWERTTEYKPAFRTKIINEAIHKSKKLNHTAIAYRYAFLAVRMCYYNNDAVLLRKVFDSTFTAKNTPHNSVYYCALHFRSLVEADSAKSNYMAAQVFCNEPQKRWASFNAFIRNVPIHQVLKHANTPLEKANVYEATASFQLDKALPNIQQLVALNPHTHALEFLIQREINKVEDWVYTPYYSLFSPSVQQHMEYEDEGEKQLIARSEKDRLYAQEIIQWMNQIPADRFVHKGFVNMSLAHLYFLTRNYDACLLEIKKARKMFVAADTSNFPQLDKLYALASISKNAMESFEIAKDLQPILMKYVNDLHFLFAVAREIEYKGNQKLAALLFSKVVGNEYEEAVYWSMRRMFARDNWSYYYYYFDYLNFEYEPQVIEDALAFSEKSSGNDEFMNWLCSRFRDDKNKLLDLVGTKYIRKNNLVAAQQTFNKIPYEYWSGFYGNWEHSEGNGSNVFDQNPFYSLKYTPDFISKRDTFIVTKKTFTDKLLTLLNKAENPKTKDKDYLYFLIANAYYNMTFEGNSWMMRRFNKSCYMIPSNLEDDNEYYEANLALQYYSLAMQHSRKKKFKALCLRMMARCERDKLEHLAQLKGTHEEHVTNKFVIELQKRYPNYYDDLVNSSCGFFAEYFSGKKPS